MNDDIKNAPQEIQEPDDISRRQLLRRWGPPLATTLAVAAIAPNLIGRAGRHERRVDEVAGQPPNWLAGLDPAPALAVAQGSGPRENLHRALKALQGIESFVHSGENVAIKPNCAWDRRPEQAANTNPELVAELVKLCFAAGAATVTVVDNTCNKPERCFARSGIRAAAEQEGAKVMHQDNSKTVNLDLGGTALGPWKVLAPLAAADRVINVPVVKHHSLSRATIGMKNWIGAVVGNRASMHQRLPLICAELAAAFRPTLTVIDATRILVSGGPTGGSLEQVRQLDTVAVTTDSVAGDSWGASLLDLTVDQLQHLPIAQRLGLGTTDYESIMRRV
ncbi:MAG: DUF362 domain-containing protein [bacterium]|nr:DUF362 domain-containing protein [bacterium]